MVKDQDLIQAVKDRNIPVLQKLLTKTGKSNKKLIGSSKRININYQDGDGMSALHQASLMGNVEMMQMLLECHADVSIHDNKGMLALHYAAWQGMSDPVHTLLQWKSPVNEVSQDGNTPLHLACQHGHFDVVNLLVLHNSSPTMQNKDKKTPLDLACEFGRYRVVDLLLRSNLCASLLMDSPEDLVDENGTTPLHLAAKNGHIEIIRLLLQAGVNINRSTLKGTSLHEAALCGKIEVVRLLLDCAIDVNKANSYDQTALDIVNSYTTSRAAKDLKQILKEASFAVQARAIKNYCNIYDPSTLAFKEGDIIKVLEQRDDAWKGVVISDGRMAKPGYFPPDAVVLLDNSAHYPSHIIEGKRVHMPNVPDLLNRSPGYLQTGLGSPFNSATLPSSSSGYLHSPGHHQSQSSLGMDHSFPPPPAMFSPNSPYKKDWDGGSAFTFSPPQTYRLYNTSSENLNGRIVNHNGEQVGEWSSLPAFASDIRNAGHGKGSPTNSNRNSAASSDSGRGYSTGHLDHANANVKPPHNFANVQINNNRLSSQSYESGVSSRQSYHSTSSSSVGSLDRLEESGQMSTINVAELFRAGMPDHEVMRVWLRDLRFEEYCILFVQAGYDMPTISHMTPQVCCSNTKCNHINHVKTGKKHGKVWDVNTKLSAAMVHVGIGVTQVNSLLSELNIPPVSHAMLDNRQKEIGRAVQDVAAESMSNALQKELGMMNEEMNEKGLVVAVDAGWQKRGSGKTYDSLSGHCSMVGPLSGKVLSYSVRSKNCRVCSVAETTNKNPAAHECSKNWEGSSKAMEADMVIEMVEDLQKSEGITIDGIIGDEDTTTIARLKTNVNANIKKLSDKNHLKKLFTNSLFTLKKEHSSLTLSVIKYIQKCFSYSIAQGKGNALQIQEDLSSIPYHIFGDHEHCSARWCKFIDNPNLRYKSLPHGKPLKDRFLQDDLKEVFSSYASHSDRLSCLGSTQSNESFNRMVSAKAPKTHHYSSSSSLRYRVAACVAQKNEGHRYLIKDLSAIGITKPGHRKRLKAEIARLNIHDGIPDFKPVDMMEWLHMLGLEQYYNTLSQQGYTDLDKVTDITWEDLEEIGIQKLGHQKKITLAIERLKRINANSKRLSSMDRSGHSEIIDPPPPLGHTRWSGEDYIHEIPSSPFKTKKSLSGDNLNSDRLSQKSDRYSQHSDNSLEFVSHSPNTSYQPDVVAIQVKRHASQSESPKDMSGARISSFQGPSSVREDRDSTPTAEEELEQQPAPIVAPSVPKAVIKPKPVAKIIAKTKRSSKETSPEIIDIEKYEAQKNHEIGISPGKSFLLNAGMLKKTGQSDHIYDQPRMQNSPKSPKSPTHTPMSQPFPVSTTAPVFVSVSNQNGSQQPQNSPTNRKVPPPPPPKRTNSISNRQDTNSSRYAGSIPKSALQNNDQNTQKTPAMPTGNSSQQTPRRGSIEDSQKQLAFASCVQSLSVKFGSKRMETSSEDVNSSDGEDFPPPPPPIAMDIITPKIHNYGIPSKDDKTPAELRGMGKLGQPSTPNGSSSPSQVKNSTDKPNSFTYKAPVLQTVKENPSPPVVSMVPNFTKNPPVLNHVTTTAQSKDQVQTSPRVQHVSHELKRKDSTSSSDSVVSASSVDSNTLPFANENVGTIKQRAPAAKPSIVPINESPAQGNGQGFPDHQRVLPSVPQKPSIPAHLKAPNKGPRPTVAMKPNASPPVPAKPKIGRKKDEDVLNDIDNMLQGLTEELDAMLEEELEIDE